jgi:hypothetical protein
VPLHATLVPFLHAYALGTELGDLDFSAIAAHSYCLFGFHCGNELAELESRIPCYRLAIEQTQRISDAALFRIIQESIQKLMGKNQGTLPIFDPALDHEQQLHELGVQSASGR